MNPRPLAVNRICVIGPPGSGKSTVARALGEILNLPVVHLDTLYWKPGWIDSDPDDFDTRVLEQTVRDRWVIDGNYTRTLPQRLARADVVVFLDLPHALSIFRILKRRIRYARKPRPDITAGCDERIDLGFFRFAWNWRGISRTRKLELLAQSDLQAQVVMLCSRRDVRTYLAALRAQRASR